MIVNQWLRTYECIDQHVHGKHAGQLSEAWKDPAFREDPNYQSVLFAIKNHDIGWKKLDRSPLWSKENNCPHDFTTYPMDKKIKAYREGISQIEKKDTYAGLLMSLHYASFFKKPETKEQTEFVHGEQERQRKLRALTDTKKEEDHLKLLQFCDDLSLFICMNRPGVPKDEEVAWFRSGFRQTFSLLGHKTIHASWSGRHTVRVHPFPFEKPIYTVIPVFHIAIPNKNELFRDVWKEGIIGNRTVLICANES
ncbi:DUF3891 family protein [Salsuginibacillus kocurii]|uniref:DUF3891 family protein n=1 Tax=Salsuginibacillus kocurii TaxID=427078 RepID=UPI000366BEAF|nr:DUF3891 family protein [Salsuginibacillus kocurii]